MDRRAFIGSVAALGLGAATGKSEELVTASGHTIRPGDLISMRTFEHSVLEKNCGYDGQEIVRTHGVTEFVLKWDGKIKVIWVRGKFENLDTLLYPNRTVEEQHLNLEYQRIDCQGLSAPVFDSKLIPNPVVHTDAPVLRERSQEFCVNIARRRVQEGYERYWNDPKAHAIGQ